MLKKKNHPNTSKTPENLRKLILKIIEFFFKESLCFFLSFQNKNDHLETNPKFILITPPIHQDRSTFLPDMEGEEEKWEEGRRSFVTAH